MVERRQHVGGRGEAPLPGALEVAPLVVEIEAQRVGIARALGQRRWPRHDEADPGHALEALVGRRHDRVAREVVQVERQRAEGAHGVEQEPPPAALDDLRDLADRVQDPRRRLAVHGGDVGDGGIGGEGGVQRGGRGRHVLRCLERGARAAHHVEDAHHAQFRRRR